jgi:hypothetical protein
MTWVSVRSSKPVIEKVLLDDYILSLCVKLEFITLIGG